MKNMNVPRDHVINVMVEEPLTKFWLLPYDVVTRRLKIVATFSSSCIESRSQLSYFKYIFAFLEISREHVLFFRLHFVSFRSLVYFK